MFAWKEDLYLWGGTNKKGLLEMPKLWRLKMNNKKGNTNKSGLPRWEIVKTCSAQTPSGRDEHAGVLYKVKYYITCGHHRCPGNLLNDTWALNLSLFALSVSAQELANPMDKTMRCVNQLLDYKHSSDDSYLSAGKGRSCPEEYFLLGSLPHYGKPIWLNGNIHFTCAILKLVAASAAEAELITLFLNGQEAKIIRLVLEEIGHLQPPTLIHVDNTNTAGIVKNTIKRQRSCAMEMRYFWLLSQEAQKMLAVSQHPGAENMGNFPSKAHTAPVCRHVRPYFVNMGYSPLVLLWAPSPSSQRGCAETLGDLYIRGLLLPRIPLSHELKPDDG